MTSGKNKKAEAPLPANCVEEEYLYVTMQRCKCGGTYEHDGQSLTKRGEINCDELRVRCKECGGKRVFLFDISAFFGDMSKYGVIVQPSRLFDVVEWLGLAALFIRDSQTLSGENRRMMLAEADFCLDQALMFYKEESDVPVKEAFFHQPDRKIARERIGLVSKKQVLVLKKRTGVARAEQNREENS
jgi:hypothetical protein